MDLRNYWEENLRKNMRKISAIIGDIFITILTILFFCLKGDIDWITAGVMILFGVKPFIVMYLNIVFKGEADDVRAENAKLREKATYDLQIAGYAIQLAAIKGQVPESIIANEKWIDANKALEILNGEAAAQKAMELMSQDIENEKLSSNEFKAEMEDAIKK